MADGWSGNDGWSSNDGWSGNDGWRWDWDVEDEELEAAMRIIVSTRAVAGSDLCIPSEIPRL